MRPHHSDPCPAPKVPLSEASQPAPRPSLPASPVQPGPPSPTSAVDWSSATPPCPMLTLYLLTFPIPSFIASSLHRDRGRGSQKTQTAQRRCDLARPQCPALPCPALTAKRQEHTRSSQSGRGITERKTIILFSSARIRFLILSFSRLFLPLLFHPSATKLCSPAAASSKSNSLRSRPFSLPSLLLYGCAPHSSTLDCVFSCLTAA